MNSLKLGKLPRKEHPLTLDLSKYVKLADPPRAFAYEYNISDWTMMGNDKIGDCTFASPGHLEMEWSSRTYGLYIPSLQDIIRGYSAVSGYDPQTGMNDNGCVITDVLEYWRTTGIANRKILGWAQIDTSNITAIKQAITIFGGLDIGFNVTETAMNEFSSGQAWNNTSDKNIVGGHCVCVLGYGSLGCTCITWAKRQQMSWEFWKTYVDEAYAIITQDWLTAAQKTPIFGFDLQTLQADLQALKAA